MGYKQLSELNISIATETSHKRKKNLEEILRVAKGKDGSRSPVVRKYIQLALPIAMAQQTYHKFASGSLSKTQRQWHLRLFEWVLKMYPDEMNLSYESYKASVKTDGSSDKNEAAINNAGIVEKFVIHCAAQMTHAIDGHRFVQYHIFHIYIYIYIYITGK